MRKRLVSHKAARELVLKMIDIPALVVDDYIAPDLIESASGYSRDDAQYSRLLQDVKEFLESGLSRLGKDLMLRGVNSGIRVLDNGAESMVYGWSQAQQGLAKTDRWFHKTTLCVDRKKLSPVELDRHEQQSREIGRILLHRSEDRIKGMEDDGLPHEDPDALEDEEPKAIEDEERRSDDDEDEPGAVVKN